MFPPLNGGKTECIVFTFLSVTAVIVYTTSLKQNIGLIKYLAEN